MIELRDVHITYPGADRPALDGVSLSIAPGETVALLGPNGSGKSTLARLCNALLVPDAGEVGVDGMATTDDGRLWDIRSRVGFVQQNPDNQIVGTVAEEDVAFGPENLGVPSDELRERVGRALADVGLAGFERREPHMLSEGQKQRLAIAGALALEPSYLVLDEPTAMLDGAGRAGVLETLARLSARGVGILHVTHQLEDVLGADRALVLSRGRVAFEGTPAELAADPERAASLGVEVPSFLVMVRALAAAGAPVPALPADAEAVVEALWPS
ncbi:MAG: ATP-binding cassette domain-containing protein [Actinobacteria bacterium]|nr:ATP-binding cassette domain-containing protein [Actinomycetota bacterium]